MSEEQQYLETNPTEPSSCVIPSSSSKRKKSKQSNEDLILDNQIKSVLDSLSSNEDQDALFGQYIAGELRQIHDEKVKLQLKMTINNEVAKARLALLSGVNEL